MYQLRSFRAAARSQSLTKAARASGYSQSSVTAHIRALEEEVGARLFRRLPHGVRLTEAGEVFGHYVDRILSMVDEMSAALAPTGETTGQVTIAVPATLIEHPVGQLLQECHYRYPAIHVSPRLFSADAVLDAVLTRTVELGIVLTAGAEDQPVVKAGTKQPALRSAVVRPVEFLSVGPPGSAAAKRRQAGPRPELAGAGQRYPGRLLVVDRGCPSHQLLAAAMGLPAGMPPAELGSVESVRQAVEAGRGLALLPAPAVRGALGSGALTVLPDLPRRTLFARLVWRDDPGMSLAARAVIGLTPLAAPDGAGTS